MVYYIHLHTQDAQRYESVYTWTLGRQLKSASKMRMLTFDIHYEDGTGDKGAWDCLLGTRIEVIGNTVSQDLIPDKDLQEVPFKNGTILAVIPYTTTSETGVAENFNRYEPQNPMEVTFVDSQCLHSIVLQFIDVDSEALLNKFVRTNRHNGEKCDLDKSIFSILLEVEE